jgi:hypothetical protein
VTPVRGQSRDARAYENGLRDGRDGQEAYPGCPTTPLGKAYMRGYLKGIEERVQNAEKPPGE